jgi:hypothetical protein
MRAPTLILSKSQNAWEELFLALAGTTRKRMQPQMRGEEM